MNGSCFTSLHFVLRSGNTRGESSSANHTSVRGILKILNVVWMKPASYQGAKMVDS
jgi:hypothetical protein